MKKVLINKIKKEFKEEVKTIFFLLLYIFILFIIIMIGEFTGLNSVLRVGLTK